MIKTESKYKSVVLLIKNQKKKEKKINKLRVE